MSVAAGLCWHWACVLLRLLLIYLPLLYCSHYSCYQYYYYYYYYYYYDDDDYDYDYDYDYDDHDHYRYHNYYCWYLNCCEYRAATTAFYCGYAKNMNRVWDWPPRSSLRWQRGVQSTLLVLVVLQLFRRGPSAIDNGVLLFLQTALPQQCLARPSH